MKIRCVENSVRLRLRKSDIEQLRTRHKVEESVQFGAMESFRFALMILPGKSVNAGFSKGRILVSIPTALAHEWMDSNQVGIETEQNLPGGKKLHILVEKDFPCKDREDEDKADTFQELADQEGNPNC